VQITDTNAMRDVSEKEPRGRQQVFRHKRGSKKRKKQKRKLGDWRELKKGDGKEPARGGVPRRTGVQIRRRLPSQGSSEIKKSKETRNYERESVTNRPSERDCVGRVKVINRATRRRGNS